jgi:hypothetical protein
MSKEENFEQELEKAEKMENDHHALRQISQVKVPQEYLEVKCSFLVIESFSFIKR